MDWITCEDKIDDEVEIDENKTAEVGMVDGDEDDEMTPDAETTVESARGSRFDKSDNRPCMLLSNFEATD
jgi:hypothetical protein